MRVDMSFYLSSIQLRKLLIMILWYTADMKHAVSLDITAEWEWVFTLVIVVSGDLITQ